MGPKRRLEMVMSRTPYEGGYYAPMPEDVEGYVDPDIYIRVEEMIDWYEEMIECLGLDICYGCDTVLDPGHTVQTHLIGDDLVPDYMRMCSVIMDLCADCRRQWLEQNIGYVGPCDYTYHKWKGGL